LLPGRNDIIVSYERGRFCLFFSAIGYMSVALFVAGRMFLPLTSYVLLFFVRCFSLLFFVIFIILVLLFYLYFLGLAEL